MVDVHTPNERRPCVTTEERAIQRPSRPNISRQVIASLGECNGEGSIHLLYLPPPTQILGIRKGECVIDSLSYPSHLQ